MKNYAKVIGILLLTSAAVFNLTGCGKKSENKTETAEQGVKKVSVEVKKINPQQFVDYIQSVGTVKPIKKANITYAEGGIIDKVINDKGSNVNKDDTLFVIENDLLKASLDGAKARYDLAQMTFDKQSEIYKDNVNSEFQFLQAKYSRNQAKADYDLIGSRYDKSFVKAPFSGYIDSKNFEEGELVPPGMTVMTLINSSKVKVLTGIPERYVGEIKLGQRAKIILPELGEKEYLGKVSFVSSSVTTTNRTFDVEILLDNPGNFIKPEMIAKVSVERKTYDSVFIIPDDVLTRTDKGYTVFIEINGKAVQREVHLISRFEDKVAIDKGLNEGENLIVVGQQNLLDGIEVNIVK